MTQSQYAIVHLVAAIVVCVSGILNWRIYYKYRQIYGENVSAIGQIRRLLAERNRDGYLALAGNIGAFAGVITLLILINTRG